MEGNHWDMEPEFWWLSCLRSCSCLQQSNDGRLFYKDAGAVRTFVGCSSGADSASSVHFIGKNGWSARLTKFISYKFNSARLSDSS